MFILILTIYLWLQTSPVSGEGHGLIQQTELHNLQILSMKIINGTETGPSLSGVQQPEQMSLTIVVYLSIQTTCFYFCCCNLRLQNCSHFSYLAYLGLKLECRNFVSPLCILQNTYRRLGDDRLNQRYVNSFGEGLNVMDVHLYEIVPHSNFNLEII